MFNLAKIKKKIPPSQREQSAMHDRLKEADPDGSQAAQHLAITMIGRGIDSPRDAMNKQDPKYWDFVELFDRAWFRKVLKLAPETKEALVDLYRKDPSALPVAPPEPQGGGGMPGGVPALASSNRLTRTAFVLPGGDVAFLTGSSWRVFGDQGERLVSAKEEPLLSMMGKRAAVVVGPGVPIGGRLRRSNNLFPGLHTGDAVEWIGDPGTLLVGAAGTVRGFFHGGCYVEFRHYPGIIYRCSADELNWSGKAAAGTQGSADQPAVAAGEGPGHLMVGDIVSLPSQDRLGNGEVIGFRDGQVQVQFPGNFAPTNCNPRELRFFRRTQDASAFRIGDIVVNIAGAICVVEAITSSPPLITVDNRRTGQRVSHSPEILRLIERAGDFRVGEEIVDEQGRRGEVVGLGSGDGSLITVNRPGSGANITYKSSPRKPPTSVGG